MSPMQGSNLKISHFSTFPTFPTSRHPESKSSITGTFSGYHISAMISLFIDELHDLQKLCNAMKEVFACPVSIKLCTR